MMSLRVQNGFLRILCYYLILVISLTSIWTFGITQISVVRNHLWGIFLKNSGDIILLTSPIWILPNKWKRFFSIVPFIVAIFVIINIWYCRFWQDIIPPYLYFQFENFNSTLLHSVEGLIKPIDIIPVLFALLPGVSLFFLTPFKYKVSNSLKCFLIGAAVLCYGCSLFLRVRSIRQWDRSYDRKLTYSEAFDQLIHPDLFHSYKSSFNKGGVFFTLKLIKTVFNDKSKIRLSAKENLEIRNFLASVPYSNPDSLLQCNSEKNLVLIIVESLNSDVINRSIGGREITPILNKLCEESGSISSLDIVTQVKSGGSIDGQVLINTGLLPVVDCVTSKEYEDRLNYLPTLARLYKGRNPICVMATDGESWGESSVNSRMGYEVITNKEFPELTSRYGNDLSMFHYGLNMIDHMDRSKPFMIQFITSSMHTPYKDKAAPVIIEFNDLKDEMKNYYTVTHYFDNSLGLFIEGLKKRGIYDNTVIIVTSDHIQHSEIENKNMGMAFFGAFNCNMTQKIDRVAGQVNIYPTILQIMGRERSVTYNGLGPAILDKTLNSAINSFGREIGKPTSTAKEAFDISTLIWKGNYFKE